MQRSYTLAELAEFLRRPTRALQKLAENGALKGRKVQGDWVFALPDVVQWMESEITAQAGTNDAIQLERAVAQNAEEDSPLDSLHSFFDVDMIDLAFPAKTQNSVIRNLVKLAVDAGKIWDPETMIEALREREQMASTALEGGVALLHPRRPQPNAIAEDFVALGVAQRGVPFGGGFNNLTDVFFLICCQTDGVYLRTLYRLARILKKPGFLDALRECETPGDVKKLIVENEDGEENV